MQKEPSSTFGAVWWPDARTVEDANLTRFMRALGVPNFEVLNERASNDPAWFHDALIRFLDYRFETPYDKVLDLSEGLPFAKWCVGGTTNVVTNCVDRRRGTPRYTQPAIVWEGEDGAVTTWTFADLDLETWRLAWGLRTLRSKRNSTVSVQILLLLKQQHSKSSSRTKEKHLQRSSKIVRFLLNKRARYIGADRSYSALRQP